jgi:hypothetical protein
LSDVGIEQSRGREGALKSMARIAGTALAATLVLATLVPIERAEALPCRVCAKRGLVAPYGWICVKWINPCISRKQR